LGIKFHWSWFWFKIVINFHCDCILMRNYYYFAMYNLTWSLILGKKLISLLSWFISINATNFYNFISSLKTPRNIKKFLIWLQHRFKFLNAFYVNQSNIKRKFSKFQLSVELSTASTWSKKYVIDVKVTVHFYIH
jgi:hypothetical protein